MVLEAHRGNLFPVVTISSGQLKQTSDGKYYIGDNGRNEEIEQTIADRLASEDENDYLIDVSYNPAGTYEWNKELATSDETGTETLNSATGKKFNVSQWRVLDVDPETGDVRLVPKYNAAEKVRFQGAMGYNNAVKLLNDACSSLYSDSSVGATAKSISMEDIEGIIGAIEEPSQKFPAHSQDGSCYPVIYGYENLAVINGELPLCDGLGMSEQSRFIQRSEGTSTSSSIGAITTATSIQPYYSSYELDINSISSELSTVLRNKSKIITPKFPDGSVTTYWIASRCICRGGINYSTTFHVRNMFGNDIEATEMFGSASYCDEFDWSEKLFPVVTIKSGQLKQTSDGEGYYIGDTEPVTPDEPSEPTITPANYGDTVNYSTSLNGVELNNWKLFYSEDDYVWLIYGDYLPNNAVPVNGTGLIVRGNGVGSTSTNNLLNGLQEESNWSNLLAGTINGKQIDYTSSADSKIKAMGSPDAKLFVNSWNEKYPNTDTYTSNQLYISGSNNSYLISRTNNPPTFADAPGVNFPGTQGIGNLLYFPSLSNNVSGYWLSSTSSAAPPDQSFSVYGNHSIVLSDYEMENIAIRPVICLPASVLNQN